MDELQAREILKQKEDAKLAEVEAQRTLEEAENKRVEDERQAELDKIEHQKYLEKREKENRKNAEQIKEQMINEIDTIHFVEEDADVCERCGNDFNSSGKTQALIQKGVDRAMIDADFHKCSCGHIEVFYNGLRLRQIEKGELYNLFQ